MLYARFVFQFLANVLFKLPVAFSHNLLPLLS
jgi:hypothetical protein